MVVVSLMGHKKVSGKAKVKNVVLYEADMSTEDAIELAVAKFNEKNPDLKLLPSAIVLEIYDESLVGTSKVVSL